MKWVIDLNKEDFNQKFKKLISILTSDSAVSERFAEILTIEESYPLACSLVGEMDFDMYESAVREYANEKDSDDSADFSKVSGGVTPFDFKSFIDKLK